MENITDGVIKELRKNADEKTREISQRFFKEEVKSRGIRSATVQKISKEYFKKIETKRKSEIFILCETLFQTGFLEDSFIACNWSYFVHKKYEATDIARFELWIKNYVNNWATCDTLCNHTLGEFIEMYPEKISRLKEMAKSGNRWTRRAAAVSLIIPARRGKFLKDIFEIADILLRDEDDMVQKGYGWMLKSASQSHEKEVFRYVIKNKKEMPRTALRYAIEKMPAEMKKKAMEK